MLSEYLLRLYVNGGSVHSARVAQRLKSICDEQLGGRYRLEIIDIMEDPAAAQDARIIATPTMIKMLPPPLRRIIGDLSNEQQVLLGLDIIPDSSSETARSAGAADDQD